jgi:hypothetical protein
MVLLSASSVVACQAQSASAAQDVSSPRIEQIETSAKFLAKSDCKNTSETVTAEITDESGIKNATLWYRVGADQQYTPVIMNSKGNQYSVTVKALDAPGGEYGTWEFYISAEDIAGNKSKSPLDTSVQLLPCVG